jgi:NADH-quinone oxidoreductase subunit H
VNAVDVVIIAVRSIAVFAVVVGLVPVLIWMERKGAAYIQDRRGPNRAQILGLRMGGFVHSIADAIKLITKEEVSPAAVYRPLYLAAPVVAFVVACLAVAVVPFTEPAWFWDRRIAFQIADLRAGLVYVLAVSSLGVYALFMAGWASNNKYSLLGALRASSQMISYELAMGLAVLAIFVVAGSLRLQDIVVDQGVIPWGWNLVRQPVAFVIFFTALLAEINRMPFDLPEGETELAGGYNVEYGSMRFAMFFVAEYVHIVVGSAVVAVLFLGGWQIPFVPSHAVLNNAAAIVFVGWPIMAALLMAVGMGLALRFNRRFGDSRDYEPLVFGVPLLLVGASLLVLFHIFGGGILPSWAPEVLRFAFQLGIMLIKTVALCAMFIWIRWSLPRFRYDQLMRLGWKGMLPLAMANVLVTAVVMLLLR